MLNTGLNKLKKIIIKQNIKNFKKYEKNIKN